MSTIPTPPAPVIALMEDHLEPAYLMSDDQRATLKRALDDRERLETNIEALRDQLETRACKNCGVTISLLWKREVKGNSANFIPLAINYDGSLHPCMKKGVA